ncbi:MAG: hypothetical protein ACRYFX_32145 [Janthinobacterium lividum]
MQTAASTEAFKTGFLSLGGTRRVIVSLGRLCVRPVTDLGSHLVTLKTEVVKHKTHGAEIKKIHYYSTGGGQQLYEYYEGGHLVQLELTSYPLPDGTGGSSFCTMRWMRGDYLSVSLRSKAIGGHLVARPHYYAQPTAAPE